MTKYSVALATVLASLCVREFLQSWLKQDAPLLVFLVSVVLSSWYGGLGPGVFATVAGGLLGTFFFINPVHTLAIPDIADKIRFALYTFEGLAFSFTIGAIKNSLRNEINLRQDMELTVGKLTKAKIAEEEAIHTKTMFLSNLTHEIRTPLGAITGYAELLNESDLSEPERRQRTQALLRNCRFLSDLVDRFLDLSKAEAGLLEIDLQKTSTHDILHAVEEMFRQRASLKNIDFKVSTNGYVPPFLMTDPVRLNQILANITANAVKFTSVGHVWVTVSSSPTLQEKKPGSYLLSLRVEDTGIGISRAQSARLFRPFSQADVHTTRKFGGTGLGLYLSRSLAQVLGGDVVLEKSEVGEGSCFLITVKADLPAESPIELKPRTEADIRGLKVLVVDDLLDNREILSRFLQRAGAAVEVVASGREAIDKAGSNHFDVVLMDVQMPEIDGCEATRCLRAQGQTMPIIALTAFASEENRTHAMSSGYTNYMTKPIDFFKLSQMIFIETRRISNRST